MELTQGASVANRYRLERRIGVGGMGEVWSATQLLTRKPVALKFLRDQAADPDTKRRFLREARASCAVRHPNVVEVHDVLELEDGAPVMVMELLEGESLEQRLKRDGRMTLGDLAAVLVRVVSAVGTAHALGIVHRDLKPDNIFLAKTPEGVDVKVLDFGIAKLTAIDGDAALTGGLTNTGTMLGTPYYMSPEQAFGEKKIDHRADIWSLGIIVYRGLSGVLPTQAENIGQILKIIMTRSIPPLREVVPGLPEDLLAVVDKMLSQDVASRPADLREVKDVLERYAGVVAEEFPAPASHFDLGSATSDASTRPLPSGTTPIGARTPSLAAPPNPKGNRSVALVLGLAAIVAAAAVGFRIFGSGARDGARAATSPSADALIAPAAAPTASAAPTVSPATTATATTEPSASAAPSAATAAPSTSAAPAAPSSARTATARPPKGPATAPAPASTPAAKPEKGSVGGVLTTPPF